MAFTPKKTTKTVTRVEFFVPNGSTARDLSDAFRYVGQQVERIKGSRYSESDDAFFVQAGDEGIIFYFEYEEEVRA